MSATVSSALTERPYAGAGRGIVRTLAVETPIAIEVNGIAYAVMMGTPADLEDYALGFALAEGMIERPDELTDAAIAELETGVVLRLTLIAARAAPLLERVRMRVSEGSCGLCGLESIEEVLRPLPALAPSQPVRASAIEAALLALGDHQGGTGAMHAAAFCDRDGTIRLVREDVGRHNALDKLVGALARGGIDPAAGFILVTARCSYELVEKTVRAGCPVLVAISAPTSLAVERAREARLTLVALARGDSMLVANDPRRMVRVILGAVLAGGKSSRFGSDKALAELGGRTLIARAIAQLEGLTEAVVVVGRQGADPRTLPDWPAPGLGPLGGLAAALNYAIAGGYKAVLSCGVDSLGLPPNLIGLLSPAPRYLEAQPVVGLWPAKAAGAIEELLFSSRKHSMIGFAAMIGARAVKVPRNPANINTLADLAEAERRHGL